MRIKTGREWVDVRDPEDDLSPAQRDLMQLLRSYRWNRSRVARHLGVTTPTVQAAIRVIRRRGVTVPEGARRGPDLGPRRRT